MERLHTIKTSHPSNTSIKMIRQNVNFISHILGYGIINKFVYFSANSKLAEITPVYENDSQ